MLLKEDYSSTLKLLLEDMCIKETKPEEIMAKLKAADAKDILKALEDKNYVCIFM